MSSVTEVGTDTPRILVFSTINISDPGIDLAGSRHLEYPASVQTMAVPCSSGLKPSWLIHALEKGFDGVFVASDGEECAYLPDCAERTSRIIAEAQAMMATRGISPDRLKMAAVCSVCAEPFANYMREFSEKLKLSS
jgi:F420-non-reducing hydrogenase iron-sulfur subunit